MPAVTTFAEEVAYLEQLEKEGLSVDERIEKAAWHFYPEEMQELKDYQNKKYGEDDVA